MMMRRRLPRIGHGHFKCRKIDQLARMDIIIIIIIVIRTTISFWELRLFNVITCLCMAWEWVLKCNTHSLNNLTPDMR